MRGRLAIGTVLALASIARVAAAVAPVTVDSLEAAGARPIGGAELSRLILHRKVEFTAVEGGARETVVYGDRRVDSSGRAADYEIGDAGIIEELADGERAVSFYRRHNRVYACVDLECPYTVTSAPARSQSLSKRTDR